MIHTVIGATVICAALLFIIWIMIIGVLKAEHHGGKRDFYSGRAFDPRWSTRRQFGWWEAWAEHRRARLGFRGQR